MEKHVDNPTLASNSGNKPRLDNLQIALKDFEISMGIGIYDSEQGIKQRVILNLDIDLAHKDLWDGEFTHSLCYNNLSKEIASLAQSRHFGLLEDFAEQIALICFEHNIVEKVSVQLDKPDALNDVAIPCVRMAFSR